MHNLALALLEMGHEVSGSDDEIYNPARDRLDAAGILPKEGWRAENIIDDLDLVILGMHARKDNVELLRAQELDIPIKSFPAFVYEATKDKKRIVVGGSHGKTTTTSMIMHLLKSHNLAFDYLVGAQLDDYKNMVYLSEDRPFMVIEGDEYLTSPIDRTPKFWHYKPDILVLTGIAWDHMNVFPTFEDYLYCFEKVINDLSDEAILIYYEGDEHLRTLVANAAGNFTRVPYGALGYRIENGQYYLDQNENPLQVFGQHNMENLGAAVEVCKALNLPERKTLNFIPNFGGASKRLDFINSYRLGNAYYDFAHAPSKVKATVEAVKSLKPESDLIAVLELHTYSSLNKDFLPAYHATLNQAKHAFVMYSPKTLEIKRLPAIEPSFIQEIFDHPNLTVCTDKTSLEKALSDLYLDNDTDLLFMSSGRFGGLDMAEFGQRLLGRK